MGQYVTQLNGKLLDGTDIFYRFAHGPGIAFTDAPYAPSGMLRWQGATQKIVVDPSGVVQSQVEVGEIQIINLPRAVGEAGPWDALADLVWHHNLAHLYWCPDRVWANAVLLSQGQLLQPVANLSTSSTLASTLRFPLRDPRSQLDTALQVTKYLGNNDTTAPYGVEGGADLKGKPKPILYGTVTNIPGVVVNRPLLIYQVNDGPGTVLCVRDGGVPMSGGTVIRSSLASLQSSVPAEGGYDVYSGSEGLFVKLGTAPRYRLGIDASEGATTADRTHAQIWSRLRNVRGLTPLINIDAASVAAADALDPNEVGWWYDQETTAKAAIDAVLASFSAYEIKDVITLKWEIAKLLAPSGTPSVNLRLLTPTTERKATDRPLIKLDRVQPSYLPDGIPPWRVNVQWEFNYQVFSPSDFAGNVDPTLRDTLSVDWRTESDSDSAVSTLYVASKEMTIPTGYLPGADDVTCPHALTEAQRVRALYTAGRNAYQATFKPGASDIIQAGMVQQLTYPMYGLDAGKLFRVMQAGDLIENNVRTTTVVLGLQT